MKNIGFKYIAVLGFTMLLSSCGGSSSSSADAEEGGATSVGGNGSGGALKEVLPFNLQDNTGLVAITASSAGSPYMGNWHGQLFQRAHVGDQVAPEGEQSVPIDQLITIERFIEPECASGSITYNDNAPSTPIYFLTDLGEWPGRVKYNLGASECNLVKGLSLGNGGLFRDYISGSIIGETYVLNDGDDLTVQYEASYTKFAFGGWEEREGVFNITGSSTSFSKSTRDESGNPVAHKSIIDVPREEYRQEPTGHKLVLSNFHSETEKPAAGAPAIKKQYGYTVNWNVTTEIQGGQVDYRVNDLVGLSSNNKVFPLGDYELTYAVTDPLVGSGGNDGFHVFPASGSVMVSLASHNISAEITYFKDYAIVIYNRRGSVERVKIDAPSFGL